MPLAMSCSSAPSNSSSGRRHARATTASTSTSRPGSSADVARVEQARALRDRLEQVPIDGVAVVRVALRPRADVLPFREQPGEHTFVIERLEHRHRVVARTQQPHEAGALPHVPGRLARRAQARSSDVRSNGTACLGRGARGFERAQRRAPSRRRRRRCARGRRAATRLRPSAWSATRALRPSDRSSVSRTRDHTSPAIHAISRAALREVVHERVGGREVELGGDRVLFLQREPVGARVR